MPGFGRHEGHAPEARHLGAMRRVAEIAMRRQQVGEATDFTPAHGIGLPGQREGTGPRLADLPGCQVQMDDAGIVVGAVRRLVEALAIQRQRSASAAEPARGLDDIRCLDATDIGNDCRRVLCGDPGQRRETAGMRFDIWRIDQAFGDQHVEHAVEQRDVGPRYDRQMEIGDFGALRAARVGNDDFQVRIGRPCILDVAEDDRMRHRRVGAGNEDDLGLPDVLVAAWRRIGTQRLLVAGDGGGHAEPRIGIDVVGADQPLGQLVEDIVVLRHQLAGDVEGDRVRTVGADRLGETSGRLVERLVPVEPLATAAPGAAPLRVLQTIGEFGGLGESRPLGA